MSRFYVYIKQSSINGIALYVLPKDGGMMADGTFVGEIQANNSREAIAAAWLRLLGKF